MSLCTMYRFISGFVLGVWVGSHGDPPTKVLMHLLDTTVAMIKSYGKTINNK